LGGAGETRRLLTLVNADGIIDMGPEGGNKGGRVLFEGAPKQLLAAKHSLTSAYLRS
jgi:excinuclease UvrABC ATPase subunit